MDNMSETEIKEFLYEWADGSRIPKAWAPIYGKNRENIANRLGRNLTVYDIMEDAENPESPIHPFFIWDKDEALRHCLKTDASKFENNIKKVPVIIRNVKYGKPEPVSVVIRKSGKAGEFERLDYRQVMSQEELRKQYLRNKAEELLRVKRQFDDLKEFERTCSSIQTDVKEVAPELLKEPGECVTVVND